MTWHHTSHVYILAELSVCLFVNEIWEIVDIASISLNPHPLLFISVPFFPILFSYRPLSLSLFLPLSLSLSFSLLHFMSTFYYSSFLGDSRRFCRLYRPLRHSIATWSRCCSVRTTHWIQLIPRYLHYPCFIHSFFLSFYLSFFLSFFLLFFIKFIILWLLCIR